MNRPGTPLRYPGGKQKLTPFIREILAANDLHGCVYVEPFAGGAGIGIELILAGDAKEIFLNDISYPVYSFWRAILDRAEEFCRRITSASLTIQEWRKHREILKRAKEFDPVDVGFSLFYLNRCNRSGIISGGVIGGLAQKGEWKIDARFPRNELIRRIELIAMKRSVIHVSNLDAEAFLSKKVSKIPTKSLIYCDPPYFRKADRLYLNYYQPEDHKRLAKLIQKETRYWLVSYDIAPEVEREYSSYRNIRYSLQYNAANAYKGSEIFFFSPKLKIPKSSKVTSINAALKYAMPSSH